jgi:UDP-glucose 4-epimerase
MPVSPYGICKLATEHYLEYFKRKYGTDYVVYRLSNPYGPRQVFRQTQGVISAFLHRITNDEEIVIFGDGTNSRDYIYIEDAASMIADTLRKPTKHNVYNIGSGRQISLMEIVDTLKQLFEKEIRISFQDAPKTFLQKTDISMKRFWEEFGETKATPFHEGLAKTVAYADESTES